MSSLHSYGKGFCVRLWIAPKTKPTRRSQAYQRHMKYLQYVTTTLSLQFFEWGSMGLEGWGVGRRGAWGCRFLRYHCKTIRCVWQSLEPFAGIYHHFACNPLEDWKKRLWFLVVRWHFPFLGNEMKPFFLSLLKLIDNPTYTRTATR